MTRGGSTDVLGTGSSYFHEPPFHLLQANDSNLPHLWTIFGRSRSRSSATQDLSLRRYLVRRRS